MPVIIEKNILTEVSICFYEITKNRKALLDKSKFSFKSCVHQFTLCSKSIPGVWITKVKKHRRDFSGKCVPY